MKRLLLALLLAVPAAAATISGTVTSTSGTPLPSMTVAAYTLSGTLQTATTTSAGGTYSLTVPSGTYRVLAYDMSGAYATSFYPDAESFETSASLTVATTLTNINFRLVRAGFITGHANAPNLTVTAYNLSGTRRGFTKTDAAGNFTLALPPGSYKIAAFDESLNYVTMFFDEAASFAAARVIDVVSMQSIDVSLSLPRSAKLTGTVTDRVSGAALANMRVVAYASDGTVAAQTTTGADGKYAMAARPGALRIVVDDPAGNYATTYVPDAESFATQTPINAAAGSLVINATMVRAAHITGRVTDRITGAPLASITVVAYNASGTTRAFAMTDANGAYSIVVPPGDFRVGAFDAALFYLPQFHANTTSFAAASNVHVISQQTLNAIDFALTKGARVTGRVTSRTGTPLAGITVGAYDLSGALIATANTDANGNYTLLLAPASVKLIAFDDTSHFANAYYRDAASFETAQILPLIEGQSLTADFVLDANAHAKRRVARH